MNLKTLLESIRPVDDAAYDGCIERFDGIAKPVGSLGRMETLLARIAAVQANTEIDVEKKCLLIFCADNGVVCEGVAQSNADVTTAIGRMMAEGKSCACVMAKSVGTQVFTIDVGMRDNVKGLINKKLMNGTNNIANGAAMSRDTAISAILLGAEYVKQKQAEGFKLIAVGEAGIGNTTTTSAMASVLLNKSVSDVTGRGAGLSNEGLARKREVINIAIAKNQPDPTDPIDVLSKLGGLDIAAMMGVFLGGGAYGVPIVMDGVISAIAALCAVRLEPNVARYIIPSHMSAEPAGKLLCAELDLEPILHSDMRLGEGTGAVALFPIIDMAVSVYRSAATFADIAVYTYKRDLC